MPALINFNSEREPIFKKSTIAESSNVMLNNQLNDLYELLREYLDKMRLSNEDHEKVNGLYSIFSVTFNDVDHIKKFELNADDDLEFLVGFLLDIGGNDISLNWIDTSKVINMAGVFSETEFVGDISGWDTSNVEDMSRMFKDCPFNGDITNWNTEKVTNMSFMFANNPNFSQDLSKWNTGRVRKMENMASGCPNFDKLSVINWDYKRCHDRFRMYGKSNKMMN